MKKTAAPLVEAKVHHLRSLKFAVAQGLSSGSALSADQVLGRLEARYAAQIGAKKMIHAITVDKLHQEVGFEMPVGKERL
jgi:hypothetical protein